MGVLRPHNPLTGTLRFAPLAFLTLLTLITTTRLYLFHDRPATLKWECPPGPSPAPSPSTIEEKIELEAVSFCRNPPEGPLKEQFGERGRRAAALKTWIFRAENLEGEARDRIEVATEVAAPSVFPFLAGRPRSGHVGPVKALRERHRDGTRGIVIPAGMGNLRMACHLVASLLNVHTTTLPIEMAYAGDTDMGPEEREQVKQLFPGADIRFLDVLSVFDDSTLGLAGGGWAIKPFALLASSFAEVLLADADTVLMQPPEVLFEQEGYTSKGVLLFHDRLLGKGRWDRNKWWKSQVKRPSPETERSLAWKEAYAEEGDSGIVVADKSKLGVWMGVMHAAWQNSWEVRDEVTYKAMYGDKESWWFGLELTEGEYRFERHYGGVVGWLGDREGVINEEDEKDRPAGVCSYVIAHMDDDDRLLWYNGSLLKNKKADPETFLVPTHWMVDGVWDKGFRGQFSCMEGGERGELSAWETRVVERSVEEARAVDAVFDDGTAWPRLSWTRLFRNVIYL